MVGAPSFTKDVGQELGRAPSHVCVLQVVLLCVGSCSGLCCCVSAQDHGLGLVAPCPWRVRVFQPPLTPHPGAGLRHWAHCLGVLPVQPAECSSGRGHDDLRADGGTGPVHGIRRVPCEESGQWAFQSVAFGEVQEGSVQWRQVPLTEEPGVSGGGEDGERRRLEEVELLFGGARDRLDPFCEASGLLEALLLVVGCCDVLSAQDQACAEDLRAVACSACYVVLLQSGLEALEASLATQGSEVELRGVFC